MNIIWASGCTPLVKAHLAKVIIEAAVRRLVAEPSQCGCCGIAVATHIAVVEEVMGSMVSRALCDECFDSGPQVPYMICWAELTETLNEEEAEHGKEG